MTSSRSRLCYDEARCRLEDCVADDHGRARSLSHSNRGLYTYANGDQYTGDFVEGNREGHGTLVYANGNKYLGEFHNDVRHGEGRFYWESGNTYIGEYVNDRRTGIVVVLLVVLVVLLFLERLCACTRSYRLVSLELGRGEIVFLSGQQYQGYFLDGVRHGEGLAIEGPTAAFSESWESGKLLKRFEVPYGAVVVVVHSSKPTIDSLAYTCDMHHHM